MKKEEILSDCIEEIRSVKSTIEGCTKRYPHMGHELRSLLETVAYLKPDEVTPSPHFYYFQLQLCLKINPFSALKSAI